MIRRGKADDFGDFVFLEDCCVAKLSSLILPRALFGVLNVDDLRDADEVFLPGVFESKVSFFVFFSRLKKIYRIM